MEIIKATTADAALICNIRKASILAQPRTVWDEEEVRRAANAFDLTFLKKELDTGQEFYLYGNEAFVSVKADYLAYLFVLPSSQNSGLGSKMLSFAEGKAKAGGHDNIWLWSHPYTENFYKKHSYELKPETYSPFGLPLNKFEKNLLP